MYIGTINLPHNVLIYFLLLNICSLHLPVYPGDFTQMVDFTQTYGRFYFNHKQLQQKNCIINRRCTVYRKKRILGCISVVLISHIKANLLTQFLYCKYIHGHVVRYEGPFCEVSVCVLLDVVDFGVAVSDQSL